MKHGFITVAAAIPSVKVADCDYNEKQLENLIAQAEGKGVEVIVFPELCITGYTCQDLFCQQLLLDEAEKAVLKLLDFTRSLDIIAIVGLPVVCGDLLLNCAAVIQKGDLLGLVPKTYLPNYSEFYEKRWLLLRIWMIPICFSPEILFVFLLSLRFSVLVRGYISVLRYVRMSGLRLLPAIILPCRVQNWFSIFLPAMNSLESMTT